MTKNALIIDSAMINLGGHNFSYTKAVQSALAQRGFKTDVLVNKRLELDIIKRYDYIPTFTFSAYDRPKRYSSILDLMHLYSKSIVFEKELINAFRRLGQDKYSFIFCHTIGDFELIGWNRYLSQYNLPGYLMIVMRQTLRVYSRFRLKRFIHPYWRVKQFFLNTIRAKQKSRLVLFTDSELLSAAYREIYPHRIVTLPIPIGKHILNSGDAEGQRLSEDSVSGRYGLVQNKALKIGYMGEARSPKGFHLLPDLISRVLLKSNVQVQFVIQCAIADSGNDNPIFESAVNKLEELARQVGNKLILIPERLSEFDYAELFRRLDIVLLPYLVAGYEEPTAGVFAEAMALSKPAIVPSGTWMAHELRKFEGGVEFQTGDIEDLTEKVLEVVHNYNEYAVKVQRFSPGWRNFHNPHNLVDILLKESKLDIL